MSLFDFILSIILGIAAGLIWLFTWIVGLIASFGILFFASAFPLIVTVLLLVAVAAGVRALWPTVLAYLPTLSARLSQLAEHAAAALMRQLVEVPAKRIVSAILFLFVRSEGGRSERLLFVATLAQARQAAEDRKGFLRHSDQWREMPPLSDSRPISAQRRGLLPKGFVLDRELQAQSDELLLFGRASDAVDFVAGQIAETSVYDIALRHLHWHERLSSQFPWVVVVGTDHPKEFRKLLSELREWLGIGVEIAKPLKFSLQRGCKFTDERGTITGAIESTRAPYPITCAHVIPAKCPNLRTPYHLDTCGLPAAEWEPDIALLQSHDCLDLTHARHETFVASIQDVENAAKTNKDENEKKYARRIGGFSRPRVGTIKYPRVEVPLNGITRRFASCVVEGRRRKWYFWCIPWPLVNRSFSRAADSGSWALLASADDAKNGRTPLWLGVVFAGDEMQSQVLLAYELVPYLQDLLTEGAINPFYWEG